MIEFTKEEISEMETEILKRLNPCPDCGSRDLDVGIVDRGPKDALVAVLFVCKSCDLRGAAFPFKDWPIVDDAVKYWNGIPEWRRLEQAGIECRKRMDEKLKEKNDNARYYKHP